MVIPFIFRRAIGQWDVERFCQSLACELSHSGGSFWGGDVGGDLERGQPSHADVDAPGDEHSEEQVLKRH